jgi:hypothetical protein
VPNRRCRRAYDHRLRDLVCEERDPALFAQLGIPRSTATSWIRRGSRRVVTTELFGRHEQQLRARVLKLERRVQLLLGIVRLLFVMVRLFGVYPDSQRAPSAEAKSSILGAIERAKKRIPLAIALRVLGLSASRYHAWLRLEQSCRLDDRSSCPRTIPNQLTPQEVATIQQMVTAVSFYVEQHNRTVPYSAFHGQTPDEVYFGPHPLPQPLVRPHRAEIPNVVREHGLQVPLKRPVLSIRMWMGRLLVAGAKRILPSFLARLESVVWSGTGRSNSSWVASERRKPSVCRRARW